MSFNKRGRGGGHGKQGDSHDAGKKQLQDGDGFGEHLDPAEPTSPAQAQGDPKRSPGQDTGPSTSTPQKEDLKTSTLPAQEPSKSTTDGDHKVNKQEVHPYISKTHFNPSSQVMVPSTIVSERGTASLLVREADPVFYIKAGPRGNSRKYAIRGSAIESNTKRESDKGSDSIKRNSDKGSDNSGSSERSFFQGSSSKCTESKKLPFGNLDQLSEKSKNELSKEKLQLQFQQQQHQRQQEQQQLQPNTMESRFKEFLERFVKQGTQGFFYEKQVKLMRAQGYFELTVNFNDIMRQDLQLAIDIVNYKSPEKSQDAARAFIKMHVSDEDKKAARWCASVAFVFMPDSIIPVTELLQDRDALVDVYINSFGPEHSGCNLSKLSAAILGGFLEHFLDTHAFHRAWNGDYDLSDLYVINKSQFLLKKKPSFVLKNDGTAFLPKKADLTRLIELFTPHVDRRKPEEKKNGEPPKVSELPLFYQQFCDYLQNASPEEISNPCFRACILNYPTLKTPQARHNLVCSSHLALKRHVRKSVYALVTKNPCPDHADWRTSISQSTLDVLRKVYYHREKDDGKQAASESGQEQAANEDQKRKKKQAENEPIKFEPFTGDIKGIIHYDRNLKNHVSKNGLFKSIAEVEVFSSIELCEYLPAFVKGLFSMEYDPHMKDELEGDFADILFNYKSARVRTIDGSEVKAVPQLSFWEFEPANFIK